MPLRLNCRNVDVIHITGRRNRNMNRELNRVARIYLPYQINRDDL